MSQCSASGGGARQPRPESKAFHIFSVAKINCRSFIRSFVRLNLMVSCSVFVACLCARSLRAQLFSAARIFPSSTFCHDDDDDDDDSRAQISRSNAINSFVCAMRLPTEAICVYSPLVVRGTNSMQCSFQRSPTTERRVSLTAHALARCQ